jgi:MoaA/NifB/PqqE/SkfB family radical SAM enzyme
MQIAMNKFSEKILIDPLSSIYNRLKFKAGIFPKRIQIEVTNVCNARCAMCPLKDMKRATGYIDIGLFKKIIDESSGHKLRRLILHIMGEPLLHPRIFEMIEYIKKKNPDQLVEFSTNASLLTEEMGGKLIASGLDILNLSVDAIKKETYEKIRVGLNFETTMKNIYNFLDLLDRNQNSKLLAKIQLIKMPENEAEWDEFKEKWQEFARGKKYIDLYIKEMKDWGGYLKKEKKINSGFGLKICCVSPFDSLDIFWNGDVSFCCLDYDGKLVIGNVKEKSLQEIWHNEKINQIRKRFIKNDYKGIPLCSTCESAFRFRKIC